MSERPLTGEIYGIKNDSWDTQNARPAWSIGAVMRVLDAQRNAILQASSVKPKGPRAPKRKAEVQP